MAMLANARPGRIAANSTVALVPTASLRFWPAISRGRGTGMAALRGRSLAQDYDTHTPVN